MPPSIDPEKKARILARVDAGENREVVATEEGVHPNTVSQWLRWRKFHASKQAAPEKPVEVAEVNADNIRRVVASIRNGDRLKSDVAVEFGVDIDTVKRWVARADEREKTHKAAPAAPPAVPRTRPVPDKTTAERLVLVRWKDSCLAHGWIPADEVSDVDPLDVESVGWLQPGTDGFKRLVSSRATKQGHGVIAIPDSCIISIVELREVK